MMGNCFHEPSLDHQVTMKQPSNTIIAFPGQAGVIDFPSCPGGSHGALLERFTSQPLHVPLERAIHHSEPGEKSPRCTFWFKSIMNHWSSSLFITIICHCQQETSLEAITIDYDRL